MPTLIPHAELLAVAQSHGVSLTGLPDVLTVEAVRQMVHLVREEAGRISMAKFEDAVHRHSVTQAADDLDALADRYEKEAS